MNMRRRRKHCANILGRDYFYRCFVMGHNLKAGTAVNGRRCFRVFRREGWT